MTFLLDLKYALRSLARAKGVALTVALTLALGIGANAAIFSVVRGVLLRPLVNRDESRLIYVRQSARGSGIENTTFSVPEIQDLQQSVKTPQSIGTFSTIGFTMVGLGEPRQVRAQAYVLAAPEADVVVGLAVDLEHVAVGKDLLVAVRRRIE